jgi:putative ABC transport system permease protein
LIVVWGFVPLLAGFILMRYGLQQQQDIPFSLGLTLLLLGGALLVKTFVLQTIRMTRKREKRWDENMRRVDRVANGLVATVVGLLIMAYWALPFDALVGLGLPRFQGGIEVFFVAAIMMVSGSVWALMANARWLVEPWVGFFARLPRVAALTRLATVYPLDRQVRTALSVIMFSLVVFAMTVMVIITNAMQNSYVNINTQTGGYDIQATAYFKSLPDLQSSLTQHGLSAQSFAAIGVRRTTVAGVIQLGASAPRWSIYPVEEVTGGFLQGYGLNLTARANGFNSNADVWKALQTHPDYALIDSSALPQQASSLFDTSAPSPTSPGIALPGAAPTLPNNIDPRYIYSLSGVYQGENAFPAVPVWVQGFQGSQVRKFTIIGVVDNSDGAHTGLYIPGTTYSAASLGKESDVQSSQDESYYFKIAPGQDAHKVALALGSAYLDYGLETTVLQDVILQTRGPRILLSDVLLGVVTLTLLLGVAALALTGTRAVIERRQQIGMLRALGVPRLLIQGAFLLESFLIGVTGSVLGGVLGLILARNIFAANFFEQYQTGLFFSVPWSQLALVVVVAFVAAFLGAVLPAWQAGRVAPAEALRYT